MLEERIKRAVPKVWAQISADVDWPITLKEAVELCLDADRPVTFGYLSKEDYASLLKLDSALVDAWPSQALWGYF